MTRFIEKHRAGLTFAGLLVAGVVLHYWQSAWPHWEWFSAVRELFAHALMVAGILGATVDTFLKVALIRDVGSIFIGWALPQEVRNYIREVSQTSLVRTSRQHYRFAVEGNEVVIDVTDECDVYNYSTGIRRYRPHISLDTVERPDHTRIQFEISQDGHTRRFVASDFDGTKHKTVENHSVKWQSPKRLILWPQDITQPGIQPACTTRWNYRLRLPNNYTTIAAVGTPTLGIKATIDAPDALVAFFKATEQCIHTDGSNVWDFKRLYMPDQHIRLYWYPKNNHS
jgi:hypothetical protein